MHRSAGKRNGVLAPTLAISLLAGLLLGELQLKTAAQVPQARRDDPARLNLKPPVVGVWLTNSPSPLYYKQDQIRTAVNDLHAAGFNVIYPNVWSRGTTFHQSRFAPLEPTLAKAGVELDPICSLSREAHSRGIKVVPWFEYGLMEPADSEVVKQHPEWVLKRLDGDPLMLMHGYQRVWLNPAHPEVRKRFIGLIIETLKRCRLDGIQLDDHFAWPVELGYDDYTVSRYIKDTGIAPPQDHTNRSWMIWRRRQLTGLLRELREKLDQEDLPTRISLSPGPFRFAYNLWLQDWELWAIGELIDDLVVQNYAYSLKGYAKDLEQPALRKARQWGLPVNIGILAGFGKRTTSMPLIREKVRLAEEHGYGVIYFYWEGLWGMHSGKEGPRNRQDGFRKLHSKS